MSLSHNQPFKLIDDAYGLVKGLYRMIVFDPQSDVAICVLIRPEDASHRRPGGRPIGANTKRPNQTPKKPQVGAIRKISCVLLKELLDDHEIVPQSLELPSLYYTPQGHLKAQLLFDQRCRVMAEFLDFSRLRESLIVRGSLSELVQQAVEAHGVSSSYVRRLWSMLCTYGFTTTSLRVRHDRCGAPGKKRLLSKNSSRQKAGRKTAAQRLSQKLYGVYGQPVQPGMDESWKEIILAADRKIPSPKPSMRKRYNQIVSSHFAKASTFTPDGEIEEISLKKGEYPNYQQVKRVLTKHVGWMEKILEKTSKGHFKRALRGMRSRSWEGVAGPGHTYAIDSTIGDIYLRSSLNPAWIVGRPIVYIIVDVWSTAIVGFYVCLTGPSWDTAQVSLFNTVAAPTLLGDLWGYEMRPSLYPAPTLPYMLHV